ncbi:MAG: hypothetical protein ACLURP_01635 [Ruminococcus sp.]
MEVWITRQEEKHRRYLPGILLESFLIFLVNGVGTFALLHTLIPSVNGIPFGERHCDRPSLCRSFQASGTFGCCGFLVKLQLPGSACLRSLACF